jgi:hypothetical protein
MQLRIAFCGIFFVNKNILTESYKMPVIFVAGNFLFNTVIDLDKLVYFYPPKS